MDNKVLYPCSYSSWYDLYSGTDINQESNTIRGFKCFWGLILKHLKAVCSFIHLLTHLYRKTKILLWQHSTEHVHQGTTSGTWGTACIVPLLMTTADGISLPVKEEALHSLGGFFLLSTSQLECTQVCPTWYKCACPCSCKQGFSDNSPRADICWHMETLLRHLKTLATPKAGSMP